MYTEIGGFLKFISVILKYPPPLLLQMKISITQQYNLFAL